MTICSDGRERVRMECDSEIAFQARAAKVEASALGASAKLQTEVKALREISEQLAVLALEQVEICKQFNACILDRERYILESQQIRRRASEVSERLALVRFAQEPELRRRHLSDAWRAAVPTSGRHELVVDFLVAAASPGEEGHRC